MVFPMFDALAELGAQAHDIARVAGDLEGHSSPVAPKSNGFACFNLPEAIKGYASSKYATCSLSKF